MKKLVGFQGVTFTGVDEKTDIQTLKKIQEQYPFVEFGVLLSSHWNTNGNRYPCPEFVEELCGRGLNLSGHLCGSMAKEFYRGDIEKITKTYPGIIYDDYKRLQLNVSPYKEIFETAGHCWEEFKNKEIIIQQNSDYKAYEMYKNLNENMKISMLIDPSGGRGVDSNWEILETENKIGYAGGINPDNIDEKIKIVDKSNNYWIDMESGVRTNDWFDTNKVIDVLEKIKNRL